MSLKKDYLLEMRLK